MGKNKLYNYIFKFIKVIYICFILLVGKLVMKSRKKYLNKFKLKHDKIICEMKLIYT